MSSEHPNPNPHDDPTAAPLWSGTLISTVLFVISFIAVAALYYYQEGRYRQGYYDEPRAAVGQLQAAQDVEIGQYRWTDKEKKSFGIPIQQAMLLVATELSAEQRGQQRP